MVRERITSTSHVLKERRKKSLVKILWGMLGLVVLLIGLAFVSRIESLLIDDVRVSGNEILSTEEIERATFDLLAGNRFLIFSGRNKFLYSKQHLSEGLKETFPRILSLSIERQDQTLSISLMERERAYLWCGQTPPVYGKALGQDCYFLDNSGFIFDRSPEFTPGVYFTFYTPVAKDDPIGQHVLDFDAVKDIESLVSGIESHGFPIDAVVATEEGQYELLLGVHTELSEHPKLLFTADQSVEEVYNKFVSVVLEDPFKTDYLEKRGRLEYIDARFKNRVFYRFRD